MQRLVVITDLSRAAGGATSLAIASAVGAARRGVPVTYISADGPVSEDLRAPGITLEPIAGDAISAGQRLKGLAEGLYRPSVARHVGRWIAANDSPGTVYHLHNWAKFLSPALFRPLRKVAPRLVATAHDFFLTCPNGAQYSFTEERVCPRRANSPACIAHNCDRRSYADKLWRSVRHGVRQSVFALGTSGVTYIAIHDTMVPALALGGMPTDKVRVIRNPIRPFSLERVRAEDNRTVLFVGRLTPEKGPDLAALAARAAGLPIAFVGEGPLESRLREICPDATFHGWRSREEIGEIASSARIFVMPSRWAEPYGMVAGEALWSGLPVLASDNAYLAPEIEAAGAGLAVQARDTDAFAAAMRWIASDDTVTRAMSEAAFGATNHLGNTLDRWESGHMDLYTSRLGAAV